MVKWKGCRYRRASDVSLHGACEHGFYVTTLLS